MTETTTTEPEEEALDPRYLARRESLRRAGRKIVVSVALLFIVWVAFYQGVSRMIWPESPPDLKFTPPSVLSSPLATPETQTPKPPLPVAQDDAPAPEKEAAPAPKEEPAAPEPAPVTEEKQTEAKQAQTLEQRITELQEEAAAIRDAGANTVVENTSHAAAEAMEARLKALEASIETLRQESASGRNDAGRMTDVLNEQLKSQAETISALEARISENDAGWQKASLTQAYYTLESRVQAGLPYKEAYRATLSVADEETDQAFVAALKPVAASANEGIATLKELREEFSSAARIALHPALAATSFWGRLRGNLTSLITVRRIGAHQKGQTPEAVIARAEAALNEDKLAMALDEIKSLSADAAAAMELWRKRAETRLVVTDALDAARGQLLFNESSAAAEEEAAAASSRNASKPARASSPEL